MKHHKGKGMPAKMSADHKKLHAHHKKLMKHHEKEAGRHAKALEKVSAKISPKVDTKHA